MKTLVPSSIVLLTILFSFAFGIAFGYVVIIAILRALSHKPKPKQPATTGRTAVVAPASQ